MASYSANSREEGRAPLPMENRERDWWLMPLLTVVVLTLFGIYTTFRAFENNYYLYTKNGADYLSPFYSPLLPIAWYLHLPLFGLKMVSPAIYILIFPLAFRLTCYYYRKAYYRSFFWDPPACAVAEPRADARMKYTGERKFPFILQNLHRYAFYAAVVIVIILWKDTVDAFIWTNPDGTHHFGIGVGSIVFLVNIILLSLYTFSCHSWRHLIGGKHNCYSCSCGTRSSYGIWKKVSFLNHNHALWAWVSMLSVWFTDFYVMAVASGMFKDIRIL